MSSNKTIAKNTLFLYFRMMLVMGVSLYTSRIVLKELGISDYGIYSLVGGIVALFGFLNAAMSSATQRYLTFDLGKNDPVQLRKTFSAVLTIHFMIAFLVLLFAETIGLWYVNNKMVLPESRLFAANIVFQFSIAAALLEIIQVPYNALIIAHEKMNIYAYVGIVETFLKLAIVFMLVYFGSDKLITYAILTFVVVLGIRLFYQFYCRKHHKESHYQWAWDKAYYKELISYSGWSLFGNIASIARGQGLNVVLNLFFGTTINAAYGICSTVSGAIIGFVQNFQVAVNPQIIKSYAQGEFEKMQNLIFQSAKFSYFLLLILTIPVFISTDYILHLWLHNVPTYTSVFVRLTLIFVLIDSVSFSMMVGVQATGKIKLYQIVIGTLIFLNLPISYLFLKLGFPPEVVFEVLMAITAMSLVVRMFFVNKLLGFKPIHFLSEVMFPLLAVTILLACIYFTVNHFYTTLNRVHTISDFVLNSVFYEIIGILLIIIIGTKQNEKQIAINFLKSKLNGAN